MQNLRDNRFDKILEYLCSGIKSKIEQEELQDELYDHLMTKYEINLAIGLDEEEATENAIKALGNKDAFKNAIAKVHKSYPSQTLKGALNGLSISFLLYSFSFVLGVFYNSLSISICFAGLVLSLVSLFSLKGLFKNETFGFNTVFYEFLVVFIVMIAAYSASEIESLAFVAEYGYNFGRTMFFVIAFQLIRLLKKLIKPYNEELPDTLTNSFIVVAIIGAVLIVLSIFSFLSMMFGTNLISSSLLFAAGAFSIPIYSAAFSIWISRVSQSLYQTKHNYIVEPSFKKKLAVGCCAVVLSLVCIGVTDTVVSGKLPETQPVEKEDFSFASQEEYKKIYDNLISYGVPEHILDNIHNSEINKFASSENYSLLTDEGKHIVENSKCESEKLEFTGVFNNLVVKPYSYAIPIDGDGGLNSVRVINVFYISIPNSAYRKTYRDGMFLGSKDFRLSSNKENADDYLLILKKTENGYVESIPFKVHIFDQNDYKDIQGFEFKPEDEMIIICSKTFNYDSSFITDGRIEFDYVHKTDPFSFYLRTPSAVFEAYEDEEYSDQSHSGYMIESGYSEFSWAIPKKDYK